MPAPEMVAGFLLSAATTRRKQPTGNYSLTPQRTALAVQRAIQMRGSHMQQPFRPTPNATVNIDVSASNQRVIITADSCNAIRVMNNGTATVWIDFGTVAATAALATSMPVGPGTTEVLRFQNKDGSRLYAAAIAAGATGKIYFTPGNGI